MKKSNLTLINYYYKCSECGHLIRRHRGSYYSRMPLTLIENTSMHDDVHWKGNCCNNASMIWTVNFCVVKKVTKTFWDVNHLMIKPSLPIKNVPLLLYLLLEYCWFVYSCSLLIKEWHIWLQKWISWLKGTFFVTLTLFVGLNSLLKQRLTKIRSVHCIWSTQYFEGRIEKRKGNGMCDNCILLRWGWWA